jgi:HK97 family phage portal protein
MTTPLLVTTGAHQPVWTPRRYDTLAEEGFQKNIVVYRCVSLISRGISSIPWRVYKGETPVEKHPLLSLLKNPNPQQSLSRFMEALSAYLLLAGNAYIEAVGIGKDP